MLNSNVLKRKGLVSVLVPTFNQINYLEETIASITEQTYRNLEIIICDDGSSDGTSKKILEWAERDKRIIPILSNRNEGLSLNLNKGFDRATGEYLSLMGGDDKMALDKIEKQVLFLQENPDFDVVLHWVEIFDSLSGKTLNTINSNILKSPIDWFAPEVSFGISKKNVNSTFPPTAYLARSDYALHSRYDPRLRFKNEILFAIDNFMNKPNAKWFCIPEVLGFYRMHENNMHKSKEMKEALLEETYVNYAIASARYPSLNKKLRRVFLFFLYKELYYLSIQADKKDSSLRKLARSRLKLECNLLQYWFAIISLSAKLTYKKIKN